MKLFLDCFITLPRSQCTVIITILGFLFVFLTSIDLCWCKLHYGILPVRSPSIKVLNTTGIRFGKRWPNELVPIALDEKLDPKVRVRVIEALGTIQFHTCIGFTKASFLDKSRLYVQNVEGESECSSFLGYSGAKVQPLRLSKDCNNRGIILRQLMHALGIFDVTVTNGFALPKKRDYALLRSLYKCPQESLKGNLITQIEVTTLKPTPSADVYMAEPSGSGSNPKLSTILPIPSTTPKSTAMSLKKLIMAAANGMTMGQTLRRVSTIGLPRGPYYDVPGFTMIDDMKFPPPDWRNDGRGDVVNSGWPFGIIPYKIDDSVGRAVRANIKEAIGELHRYTCLQFRPINVKKNEKYSMLFHNNRSLLKDECSSYIGFKNIKNQPVQLSDSCNTPGLILHVLMHALGFFHEHTRDDRDKFVKVLYRNVKEGKGNPLGGFCYFAFYHARENFAKVLKQHGEPVHHHGETYNYDSIMHYGLRDFSRNGKKVLIPMKNPRAQGNPLNVGQRIRLSEGDVNRVNRKYGCFGKLQNLNPAVISQSLQSPFLRMLLSQLNVRSTKTQTTSQSPFG